MGDVRVRSERIHLALVLKRRGESSSLNGIQQRCKVIELINLIKGTHSRDKSLTGLYQPHVPVG